MKRTYLMIALGLFITLSAQAFDINSVPPAGYHPGPIDYWRAPYFANAIAIDPRNWMKEVAPYQWKSIPQNSGQFSANGYPLYLETNQVLRTLGIGMEGDWHKPSTWPDRDEFYEGQIVLTWKGDADIRISNGNATFISGDSNTTATGSKIDGRRVYLMPADSAPAVDIFVMNTNDPITEVKCWLPDPADPQNSSLENQLFHPYFLELINSRDWGWIRFMDFGYINQNPQQDWGDRRPGDFAFQDGILNDRDPTLGVISWIDNSTTPPTTNYFNGDRVTGTSYETMVALCNETERNMWINIPHLATDDFITKLAQLIRYGSDGFDPYTSDQASPIFPPLDTNLTVYVEYSNEIWSGGNAFPQGNWAQYQADNYPGGAITKAQFNARQFSRAWDLFEAHLGTHRVNRVAAVWTANPSYTEEFIDELYKPEYLDPEVLATTTYFGNGIQNWANDQHVVPTNSIPPTYPATPWDSDYWTSVQLEDDLDALFKQWNRYVISGLGYGGATGYDTVDKPGGFGSYLRDIGIARNLPLVAYEGGPSIYTDQIDRGGSENDDDDGITLLMIEANRREAFGDIYTIHINQAFERGLRANVGFIDVDQWGKFGQWGHVEYLGQPLEEAVKYQTLLETYDTFSVIRSIDNPLNAVPQFDQSADLPRAETGLAYSQIISVSGGDGALTVELIGESLLDGLTFNINTLTVSGIPTQTGSSYIYLRVVDADNDPAWRTFSFPVVSRSTDLAATIDFEDQTPILYEATEVYPLIIGDYIFQCQRTNGLSIRSETVGWPDGWPSKVLRSNGYNLSMTLERMDGQPFDLFSLEIGSAECKSCKITTYQIGGETTETIINIPPQVTPLTLIELDFISVLRVDFTYYLLPDANPDTVNPVRNGVIDNLKLNQRVGGMAYTDWESTIHWAGANSNKTEDAEGDGNVNLWEYATDTDPLTSNEASSTISTDPTNAYINIRRNILANDLTWKLMVTSNLLSSWKVWSVDGVHVFSDLVDPDVDGDGSAELMRYRIPMSEEDQSLFFRIYIE